MGLIQALWAAIDNSEFDVTSLPVGKLQTKSNISSQPQADV